MPLELDGPKAAFAVAALAALLLSGCLGDPPATTGAYGCIACATVADDVPSRGHFENFLAVSPADDRHLVVAACTFDGQRFQVTAHTSFDSGQTWSVSELPYGERVPLDHPLATINFAADPGVAISPDGQTVIVAAVGLTTIPLQQPSGNLPFQSTMFLARSDDGGRTFPATNVQVLQSSLQAYPAVQDFSDHPRIVAGVDGTFLVMWGSLDLPSPFALTRFLATQDVLLASTLEVRFSASFDQGRTWTPPAVAYQDTDVHYYPPSPLVLADGRWAVMPSEYNGGDGDVYLSISSDRGARWTWDPTPMKVIGFGTAAEAPDGRLVYSYNARPEDGGAGTLPMLAVAAAPGAPWTLHALTDGPSHLWGGVENMVTVDGRGTIHVLYTWMREGASSGEVRVASLDLEGRLTTTVLEPDVAGTRAFGHYMGLAATRQGAVATWPLADRMGVETIWQTPSPLLVGNVEWLA